MDEKKKTAIMILFLSEYKVKGRDNNPIGGCKYRVGTGNNVWIDGEGTNQTSYAPTQYLLKAAAEDDNVIEKILCITSRTVAETEIETEIKTKNGEKTALAYYEKMLDDVHSKTGIKRPDVVSIPYDYTIVDDKIIEDTSSDYSMRIYKSITKEMDNLGSASQVDVYIDYTGGLRDISFLMTTIIRYLEFSNVRCKKIIYSRLGEGVNTIIDIRNIYDMYKIINGVNDFVTTGNVEQLSAVYDNIEEGAAKDFLGVLKAFSDAISLCDIKEIDETKEKIAKEISEFEKNTKDNDELYIEMIRSLIPLIRKKMYLNNDGGITYPMLIKWCLDNRLLQQAMTIYIEKMPTYYKEVDNKLYSKLAHCRHRKFKVTGTTVEEKAAAAIVTDFYMVLYACVADGFRVWQLKKIVTDICMDNGSGDYVIEREILISELEAVAKKRREGDSIRRALIKLVEVIKEYKFDNTKCSSYEEFIEYLCELWSSTSYYKYLLYGKRGVKKPKGGPFLHKAYAVEMLYVAIEGNAPWLVRELKTCGIEGEEELVALKDALELYLLIKIMRNRVNHASTGEDSEDEISATRKLSECSKFVEELKIYSDEEDKEELNLGYDILKEIIEKGITVK